MGGNTNQTNGGSAGEVHLKRNLSLPMVIMFGLAYLAPTVVFNYYGVVTTNTNGMMTLAYIMTTVVMFFSAWSYARMAEVFPKAGSAYTYVQSSIGPRVGFIAGWLVLLDYLLLPMESYLLIGIYVHKYFPVIPVWLAAGIIYLGATTKGFRELPPEMHMDEDYDPDAEEDDLPDGDTEEPAEEPADEDGEFIGDPVLEFSGK